MSAPASVSATLSASSAAGGAMSAEGAMSNALAHVKAADAIVEPYCEVEDVAENVLIDLLLKDIFAKILKSEYSL